MAVELEKIAHGQGSWEVPVNGNFDKLNQDTGQVSLTVNEELDKSLSSVY